jgi:hypothetical protein
VCVFGHGYLLKQIEIQVVKRHFPKHFVAVTPFLDGLRASEEWRCWGYKKAFAASSYQSLDKSCPLLVERHQTAKYPANKLLRGRCQQL